MVVEPPTAYFHKKGLCAFAANHSSWSLPHLSIVQPMTHFFSQGFSF